ncbi:MAG: endonuclease/exonuclease/phosphatase family protein [Roseivirga sp.]|nr:endonuclease/exonuclease/phosphatase family protein [Roseivirga sp.]
MNQFKLKILLRSFLVLIRVYCFFRQRRNKERVMAALLLLPALILLVPTYTYAITIIQSFLFQAMLVYGLLSIFWIRRHHYRLAGINFFIYLLLLMKINAPINADYQIQQGSEELSVLQFNVLAENKAYHETIDRVLHISPDFVSFQEVSKEWAEALEMGLSEIYPYRRVAKNGNKYQGIAVFSKHPLVDVEVIDWEGTSNIIGKVQVGNELVNFLSLHTRSPRSKQRWRKRNAHIARARQYVNEQTGEFLVLGDFNTVPWDRRLLNFKSSTNLVDSRKRLTPTYPTWNPFVAQIPIDYIFHSKGIGCDSLDSVDITSDHKAILGTFQIVGT